jgi:hypothetical protein
MPPALSRTLADLPDILEYPTTIPEYKSRTTQRDNHRDYLTLVLP